jgi:ribosomal protein S27AE
MPEHFSAEERRALERALAAGRSVCPRCGSALERREVPPRSDVSYVRDRIWLLCGRCGATAVLDQGRIDRARDDS